MFKEKRIQNLILFLLLFVFLTACGGPKTGNIVGVHAMADSLFFIDMNLNDVTLTNVLVVHLKNDKTVLAECSEYKMLDVKIPYTFEYTIISDPIINIEVPYYQEVTIEKVDDDLWVVVKIDPND